MHEGSAGPKSTAHNWRNGTWDMPFVVLERPNGVDSYDRRLSEVRFVLVEGSKRMGYLDAVHTRGEPTGPRAIFILELE